jgi:uncharacterized surface protein with fasciclin (FAS1) repeats
MLASAFVAIPLIAGCSESLDSAGNGSSGSAEGKSGKGKVFRSAPIEAEAEVPRGLRDASSEALIEVLQSSPRYSDYVKLLQLGEVAGDLATGDSLTVFAPVNEAVAAQARLLDSYLKPETLKSALAAMAKGQLPEIDDTESLGSLLRRGITEGELPPNRIRAGLQIQPLEGANLTLAGKGKGFQIEGVEFNAEGGTLAANGVLYPSSGLIEP